MAISRDVYDQVLIRDGFPTFSQEEVARRHAALRSAMGVQRIDCALLYGAGRFHSDVQFLSNWPGGREGYVLLPAEEDPVLLVQLYNHVPMAQRLSLIADTRWAGPDSLASVASCIKEWGLGQGRVGLIGALPFSQYERLKGLLPSVQFIDLSKAYRELRLIRSAEEIQFFRVAAELTDRSMERLEQELRPGLREYEIAAMLEGTYLDAGGYAGIHFMASTSMNQPTAFVPHQYQSDRVLQPGDALITEISGGFWGYTGQIHRTYFLGEPPADWVRLHDAAVAAYDAVEGVLRDGTTVEQVLDAAEVVHARGYTIFDDFLHGANQYAPILRTWQTDHGHPEGFVFREDMVVTIQPQLITTDQRMGLQFGETVRITRDGVERLHRYPRKMVVVA